MSSCNPSNYFALTEFPAQKISVEAERPDGATDVTNVSVVAVVSYIIMKTAAMRSLRFLLGY